MERVKTLVARVVLTCVAAMLVALPVQAASISYSDSFANQLTELAGEELRVDLFDSSLGTLTGVAITMSANLSSAGNVTNTAAQSQTFTVSTRVESFFAALATGGPSVLADYDVITPFTLIKSETYTGLAANGSAAFGPGGYATGIVAVFSSTDAADLAEFIGIGEFGYDVVTSILTSISGGGGNVFTAIQTYAGATLSVEYTYDDAVSPPVSSVPEPSTVVLLGLGIIGLAIVGRNRM